jgi:hypothetical protein
MRRAAEAKGLVQNHSGMLDCGFKTLRDWNLGERGSRHG